MRKGKMINNKKSKDILVYHCLATDNQVYLTCKVSKNIHSAIFSKADSKFKHLIKVIKLFLFRDKGEHHIQVKINGEIFEYKTNKYSFLTIFEKISSTVNDIEIKLKQDLVFKKVTFEKFNIDQKILISDIDDTILKSHATNYIKLVLKTLFSQLSKRDSFTDTSDFYNKLSEKWSVIYLSNSTWDIFPLVKAFLNEFKFPSGQVLLQNLRDKEIIHKKHVLTKIQLMHPKAKFILIGDEGQKDLSYYFDFAQKHPEQVESIYIRKLWWKITEDNIDYVNLAQKLNIDFKYFKEVLELSSTCKSF